MIKLPSYLTELLNYYKPGRCLRSSSDTTRLAITPSTTALGDKRFQVTAARSWNSLPVNIRTTSSVELFKKLLKTHLF
jgi:hypothetical protein